MVIKFRKFIKIKKIVFDENFFKIPKERLIFLGFFLYYISQFYYATVFNFPLKLVQLAKYGGLFLILVKISVFDKYTAKKWFVLFCLAGLFFVSAYYSTYKFLLEYVIVVMGFKDVDYKKIINYFIVICASSLFFTIVCCKLGFVRNVINYRRDGTVRQSLGIVYPTDFAAFFFYLVAAVICIKDSITDKETAVFFIGLLILYKITDARLDCLLILLLFIVFKVLPHIDVKIYEQKTVKRIIYSLFILCSIVMVLLTSAYDGKNKYINKIDSLLSNRLYYGKQMLDKNGIKLFGQEVKERGGHEGDESDYAFIDCSYLKILIKYGLVSYFIVGLCTILMINKLYEKKMYKMIVVFAVLLVNSMIAQHYLEIAYNFMIPLLLSHIYKDENQENIIC